MPTTITLTAGTIQLSGQLNDSPTARMLLALLPLKIEMNRWGEEYYGSLPQKLKIGQEPGAREKMAIGDLAYWPPGNALCIFFGSTPVSEGGEPRAASPVNPVGMISGEVAALRALGSFIEVSVRRA